MNGKSLMCAFLLETNLRIPSLRSLSLYIGIEQKILLGCCENFIRRYKNAHNLMGHEMPIGKVQRYVNHQCPCVVQLTIKFAFLIVHFKLKSSSNHCHFFAPPRILTVFCVYTGAKKTPKKKHDTCFQLAQSLVTLTRLNFDSCNSFHLCTFTHNFFFFF